MTKQIKFDEYKKGVSQLRKIFEDCGISSIPFHVGEVDGQPKGIYTTRLLSDDEFEKADSAIDKAIIAGNTDLSNYAIQITSPHKKSIWGTYGIAS